MPERWRVISPDVPDTFAGNAAGSMGRGAVNGARKWREPPDGCSGENKQSIKSKTMEFKSLKNIESSFRQIRLFGIVFLVVCLAITVTPYGVPTRLPKRGDGVLDGGKSLILALSQDLSQNRPVEAREHVKRFHELFFTLSPDKSAIKGEHQTGLATGGQERSTITPTLPRRGITTASFRRP